jgi:hypothetical protein
MVEMMIVASWGKKAAAERRESETRFAISDKSLR